MPTICFADPAHFRQAIGLLAKHGITIASRDPDTLIVGKREIEFLRREDLLDEETLARFGLQRTRDKELVDLFLSRYGQQEFPYSNELLSQLHRGGSRVVAGPGIPADGNNLPCSHYALIYEQRAQCLAAAGGTKAEQYEIFRGLVENLERTPNEPCQLWVFWLPDGSSFGVLEKTTNEAIAGCFQRDD